jgi:two-component system, sensor histidine kinase
MNMKNRLKTNLGFALACILIFIIGIISYHSLNKYITGSDETFRTLKIQTDMEKLSAEYAQAKSSVRGFHVAVKEEFIEEYYVTKNHIQKILEKIRKNTLDNPRQQKEIDTLEIALWERFKNWEDNFEQRRKAGLSFSLQLAHPNSEWRMIEQRIYHSIDKIKQEEQTRSSLNASELGKFSSFTMIVVVIGSFCAIGLILTAAYLVNRDAKKRELAEKELETFFAVSVDLLSISGMDGYFRKISPAWADLLGYSIEELFTIPLLDLVHPEDMQKTLDEIERQKYGSKVLQFENRWRTKDGRWVDLSWKSVPVGDIMYGAARDITKQKIFEKELIDAQRNAQSAAKVKTEFLANMSHEIRTPLNGIIGVTDLLDGTNLNLEQKRFIATIRNSGSMLLKIINEILDFSKIEAGKLDLETIDFNVTTLLENQVSLVGPIAAEKNLKIITTVDPEIPQHVKGDSGRISQIILNLVNNAIKFTDHGHIEIKANLLSKSADSVMVKFSVTDSGIGMTESQVKRIFAPFNQADNTTARKYGGTGLGLSISKKLAEMMGGEINVESVPDRGSLFWFTVNLGYSEIELKSQTRSMKIPNLSKHLRVLVAEDNQVNQMIIKKMLEKLGHTVLLVSNGLEAVNMFKESPYDLILMDHHMPIMDGMEATKLIRKMEGLGKRTPILAFTANVVEESQKAFSEAGVDDFILKPVTIHALEETLHKWISL